MQADLLPFIDWDNHPRQIIAPQQMIIAAGDPTDMLFLLENGMAIAPSASIQPVTLAGRGKSTIDDAIPDIRYEAGALLSLLEMLSLDFYRNNVLAKDECRVISINRHEVKAMWNRESQLAWPLSCSIASSITQRRTRRISR